MKKNITLLLFFFMLLTVSGQITYPSTSYELSKDGQTLLKWKGVETEVNLQADPNLRQVKHIADEAFKDTQGTLEKIIFPDDLETIGNHAFYNSSKLTGSLKIPNRVRSIGEAAFAHCLGLGPDLIIPNSVTTIGGSAFAFSSGFNNIEFGAGLTKIGGMAFAHLQMVERVRFRSTIPPNIEDSAFDRFMVMSIVVPKGSVKAYEKAPNMPSGEITSGVKTVESFAKAVRFYPSPVENMLTIESQKSILEYTVYTTIGQKILNKKLNDNSLELKIDMSGLQPSAYLVCIKTKDDSTVLKVLKK